MADTVKIIDSQQAFDDLTKLVKQLNGVEKQIIKMADAASKMNASLSGLTSIGPPASVPFFKNEDEESFFLRLKNS